jgi:hypothetical protein
MQRRKKVELKEEKKVNQSRVTIIEARQKAMRGQKTLLTAFTLGHSRLQHNNFPNKSIVIFFFHRMQSYLLILFLAILQIDHFMELSPD